MQEETERILEVKKLKKEYLFETLIDTISINLKSVMIAAVCCLAMITVFNYFTIDVAYLMPCGIALGISIFLFYTRPKQKEADFVRKVKFIIKIEDLIKNNLTKDV